MFFSPIAFVVTPFVGEAIIIVVVVVVVVVVIVAADAAEGDKRKRVTKKEEKAEAIPERRFCACRSTTTGLQLSRENMVMILTLLMM